MVKEKIRKVEIKEREKEVISLISYGYTDKEISEELNITGCVLRSLLSHLYCKTNTLNRQHLIAWAFRNKIIK